MYHGSYCIKCFSYLGPGEDKCCPVCSIKPRRDRAYYRYSRQRIIKKRQHIIRDIWGWGHDFIAIDIEGNRINERREPEKFFSFTTEWEVDNQYRKEPGRLAKYNLSCGCYMCKQEKHDKILKRKYIYIPDED